MTEKLTEAEIKAQTKLRIDKHRNDAVAWANEQSEAQLLQTISDQRNMIAEIKAEADVRAEAHVAWDNALTDVLLQRMAQTGVKSMRVQNIGLATISAKRVFSISDPQALYEHVVQTESIAALGMVQSQCQRTVVLIFERTQHLPHPACVSNCNAAVPEPARERSGH